MSSNARILSRLIKSNILSTTENNDTSDDFITREDLIVDLATSNLDAALGDVAIGGSAAVTGDVAVQGNLGVNVDLEVNGDALVSNELTVAKDINAGKDIQVTGVVSAGALAGNGTPIFNVAKSNFEGSIIVNKYNIQNNFTIPEGENALSVGDINIAEGVEITISPNSTWAIIL